MSLRTLLLWSVLGAVLFASAVPIADAFFKPRGHKANHLAADKQGNWLSKHWQAAVFAAGFGVIGMCSLQACQPSPIEKSESAPIINTEVAQSLIADDTLLYAKILSGEEKVELVYYIRDGGQVTNIGWLMEKKDFMGNRHILPYKPDYKSLPDNLSIVTKDNITDYLPFLPNQETVPNEDIVGKFLPLDKLPLGTAFNNMWGDMLGGAIFATIEPLEAKEKTSQPVTYVALVTYVNGVELEADDRFFEIISNYSSKELLLYFDLPIWPLSEPTRAWIHPLHQQAEMAREAVHQVADLLKIK